MLFELNKFGCGPIRNPFVNTSSRLVKCCRGVKHRIKLLCHYAGIIGSNIMPITDTKEYEHITNSMVFKNVINLRNYWGVIALWLYSTTISKIIELEASTDISPTSFSFSSILTLGRHSMPTEGFLSLLSLSPKESYNQWTIN